MSDIPDWLVELAAQQGQQDEDEEEDDAEWDFLQAEPAAAPGESFTTSPDFAPGPFTEPLDGSGVPSPVTNVPENDPLAALRSQVDLVEPDETPAARPASRALDFRLGGLRPWQQLVLSVLVFLDVVVIGLLFLVMLGRVGIP